MLVNGRRGGAIIVIAGLMVVLALVILFVWVRKPPRKQPLPQAAPAGASNLQTLPLGKQFQSRCLANGDGWGIVA
jgi:hypothetical protein